MEYLTDFMECHSINGKHLGMRVTQEAAEIKECGC